MENQYIGKIGKDYEEHEGRVIKDSRFRHVMALALDPSSNYTKGVLRCITSREGNVEIKGFVDRSELYYVSGSSLESFKVGEKLKIENEEKIISGLSSPEYDFIGLEDPDIFIDPDTGLTHLYFTIAFKPKNHEKYHTQIHLGHAVGKDLNSLTMTPPVLLDNIELSAKEISIAPVNSKGVRYNLIESRDRQGDTTYSIVKIAVVKTMGDPWQYDKTVFHPKEHNISWIGGHASPGPLLPKSFIDLGENKLLGIINGREANQPMGSETKYGIFSVGLFIYDYEKGEIEWVSAEPFIRDSQAKIITFASQFVETKPGEGILYAHVDDSFVRAYTLKSDQIKKLLKDHGIITRKIAN